MLDALWATSHSPTGKARGTLPFGLLEEKLKAKGFKVDTHVRYGDDAEEILDHAAQKEIGLIAMSTHGRGGVKRFLLGSVAEKVLRHSPKPIFLVRCTVG